MNQHEKAGHRSQEGQRQGARLTALLRRSFERGCHCIADGRLPVMPASASDMDALARYTALCRCSWDQSGR